MIRCELSFFYFFFFPVTSKAFVTLFPPIFFIFHVYLFSYVFSSSFTNFILIFSHFFSHFFLLFLFFFQLSNFSFKFFPFFLSFLLSFFFFFFFFFFHHHINLKWDINSADHSGVPRTRCEKVSTYKNKNK